MTAVAFDPALAIGVFDDEKAIPESLRHRKQKTHVEAPKPAAVPVGCALLAATDRALFARTAAERALGREEVKKLMRPWEG